MKSKAHMKKCLELGVSMSSVEDAEADEGGRKTYAHWLQCPQLLQTGAAWKGGGPAK